jgi:hypothetical protein
MASNQATDVAAPGAAPMPAPVSSACVNCGQPLPAGQYGGARAPSWGGFVYAVGRLSPQFATLGVEKEFTQLADRGETRGSLEVDQLRRVLSDPDNRYLARHVCWVFTAQHVDAFLVVPRDSEDLVRLVDALPAGGDEDVVHVLVGGPPTVPVASPCAGLGLPVVAPEQLLSFTLDEFIDALPRPEPEGEQPLDEQGYRAVARDLCLRLTRRAENRGITDEHRALNYVALRYPPVYHTTVQAYRDGKSLIGVDARHSSSGTRRAVSVRLTFRDRRTNVVERYHCLVDVNDLFPFLASPLTPTYD